MQFRLGLFPRYRQPFRSLIDHHRRQDNKTSFIWSAVIGPANESRDQRKQTPSRRLKRSGASPSEAPKRLRIRL